MHLFPLYVCPAEWTRTNGSQSWRAGILRARRLLSGVDALVSPQGTLTRLRVFFFGATLSTWDSSCDSAESVRLTIHVLSDGRGATEKRSTGFSLSCSSFIFLRRDG